jgi:hypothetical protein
MKEKLLLLNFTVVCAAMLCLQGCYYDNEEDLYPAVEICDTTNITFAKNVQPIIVQHCVGCHNNGNKENFSLEGYDKVKAKVDEGLILPNIMHSKDALPMPKDMPKLPECKINTIERWIKEGAKND